MLQNKARVGFQNDSLRVSIIAPIAVFVWTGVGSHTARLGVFIGLLVSSPS